MNKSPNKQYGRYLIALMSYSDKVAYPKTLKLSIEQLEALNTEVLPKWMRWKVFGIDEPGANNLHTRCWSGTLKVCKKQSLGTCQTKRHLGITKWDMVTTAKR
jgi:hypothetical protein